MLHWIEVALVCLIVLACGALMALAPIITRRWGAVLAGRDFARWNLLLTPLVRGAGGTTRRFAKDFPLVVEFHHRQVERFATYTKYRKRALLVLLFFWIVGMFVNGYLGGYKGMETLRPPILHIVFLINVPLLASILYWLYTVAVVWSSRILANESGTFIRFEWSLRNPGDGGFRSARLAIRGRRIAETFLALRGGRVPDAIKPKDFDEYSPWIAQPARIPPIPAIPVQHLEPEELRDAPDARS